MRRISSLYTDAEIVEELGRRIAGYRLQQNRKLVEVAKAGGVSFRTAIRVEQGEHPSMLNFIKMLRALGRIEALEAFLPTPTASPIQMARMAGKVRKRARGPRKNGTGIEGTKK